MALSGQAKGEVEGSEVERQNSRPQQETLASLTIAGILFLKILCLQADPLNPTPLETALLETLRRSGPMTFEQFMAQCLYHPQFGYYMQGRERTGIRGDYFTSSDLHPIFARLNARQAAEMWERLGRPADFKWVEMGAGRGLFARDFLEWVERARPDFGRALGYVLVEPGPRQHSHLEQMFERERRRGRVEVRAGLEELEPATACFFSNELVDAFPVAVVTRHRGHLKEVYVAAEGEALREELGPMSDPEIAAAVARYANRLEEGHRVEVNRKAIHWMRAVAEKLARGFVITVDYGDLAEHLSTPDRPRGTLMAYRGHIAYEDVLKDPGEQDLTAHVNFSALIESGKQAGLELTGFTTQEKYLMALGEESQFADLYLPGQTEAEKLQSRLQLKRLIHPGGMGTIFKVLIQHRGLAAPRLEGLKYSDE